MFSKVGEANYTSESNNSLPILSPQGTRASIVASSTLSPAATSIIQGEIKEGIPLQERVSPTSKPQTYFGRFTAEDLRKESNYRKGIDDQEVSRIFNNFWPTSLIRETENGVFFISIKVAKGTTFTVHHILLEDDDKKQYPSIEEGIRALVLRYTYIESNPYFWGSGTSSDFATIPLPNNSFFFYKTPSNAYVFVVQTSEGRKEDTYLLSGCIGEIEIIEGKIDSKGECTPLVSAKRLRMTPYYHGKIPTAEAEALLKSGQAVYRDKATSGMATIEGENVFCEEGRPVISYFDEKDISRAQAISNKYKFNDDFYFPFYENIYGRLIPCKDSAKSIALQLANSPPKPAVKPQETVVVQPQPAKSQKELQDDFNNSLLKLKSDTLVFLVQSRWKESTESKLRWDIIPTDSDTPRKMKEASQKSDSSFKDVLCVQETENGPRVGFTFRKWSDPEKIVEIENNKAWRRLSKAEVLKFVQSYHPENRSESEWYVKAVNYFQGTIDLYPTLPKDPNKDSYSIDSLKSKFEELIKETQSKFAEKPKPVSRPTQTIDITDQQRQLTVKIDAPLKAVLGYIWNGLFDSAFVLNEDNVDKIFKKLEVEWPDRRVLTFADYKKVFTAFALISSPDKTKDTKLTELYKLIGPYHTEIKNGWQPKECENVSYLISEAERVNDFNRRSSVGGSEAMYGYQSNSSSFGSASFQGSATSFQGRRYTNLTGMFWNTMGGKQS